jgi:hypothetical protein
MEKRIRITLEDGRVFSVEASAVAHDRASYYAAKDPDTSYQEEYDFTLGDSSELVDWLQNNMNWWEMNPRLEGQKEQPALRDAEVEQIRVVSA